MYKDPVKRDMFACFMQSIYDTVGGRNPAPVGKYEVPMKHCNYIWDHSGKTIYQLVYDFFHR